VDLISTNDNESNHSPKGPLLVLVIAALGVIYGDIGTSPLYALQTAFGDTVGLAVTPMHVYGLLSMFIWGLTLIVTVKYVMVVMRASNKGEGGTLALSALAIRFLKGRSRRLVMVVSIIGVSLFAADAVLTPSISVLSAMEGMSSVTPNATKYEVPGALFILSILFAAQRWGTGGIGKIFGSVMILWFAMISALGVHGIMKNPEVLNALNPYYAYRLAVKFPAQSFAAIGAVTLCITGVEALYADLGHFGRRAINMSWIIVVFPALTLCYLGQGGLILLNAAAAKNPFFALVPLGYELPVVILATLATIVASQAVISGMYTIAHQSMLVGFLPWMRVLHTSKTIRGQITIPTVTFLMYIAVMAAVIGFGSSSRLANAYGLTVTGTLVCTTFLAVIVARKHWKWSIWLCALVFVPMGIVDLLFFSANATKFLDGAWFTVAIAAALFFVIWSWSKGFKMLRQSSAKREISLQGFLESVKAKGERRVPGTGVFPAEAVGAAPRPLIAMFRRFSCMFEQTILLTVTTADTPYVERDDRLQATEIQSGLWQVNICYGFAESPNVPKTLAECALTFPIDPETTTYFISRLLPTMPTRLREVFGLRLFVLMHRNSPGQAEFYLMPQDQTVTILTRVDI
jgi:KUP system potassium uptake protein